MISLFRDFTKSWVFTAIMALLILSFAVFGLRDVFGSANTDYVVTAGSRHVTSDDFKARIDQYKAQYAQKNNGQTFTNQEFVTSGSYLQALDSIADETAFSAWLDKLNIKATPKMIVAQLAKIPAFFNSVTGRFDKDTYRQRLAENQMTQQQFESNMADELAVQQYTHAALGGLHAPRILSAVEAAYEEQSRDVRVFTLSPNNVAHPAPPTDAQIADYYKAHLQQLQLPELRTASVIRFSASDYEKSVPVTDADLQKLYNQELPTLKTPETRSFVEITAPDEAAAKAISADLKAGKSPDDAAKAHKGNVISFDNKTQDDVPDAAIAASAFGMASGDVSGALKGSLGYAVVKMGDIKPGTTPSFESLRAKLTDDYRKSAAADKVNDLVHKFQDAHDAGDDFKTSAAKLGLTITQLQPMTAQGKTGNPQVDYSPYTDLVKDVYDLSAVGATSDVERMSDGEYFALRLDAIKPAGPPPLAEVKNDLARYYMMEKMGDAVKAKADEAKARLDKGEDFAKVAAAYNAPIQTLTALDRNKAQQAKLPDAMANSIFLGQAGDTFEAAADTSGLAYAIGHIDAVHQADPKTANILAASASDQMSQMIARDLAGITQSTARTLVKTKTYPLAAIKALGVTPPATTKDGAKDKGADKDKS
ncbi:peptidylprolyl isomerase [Asticcacaulis sp. EMRT-3]|uniref:peptidylprolyl isomerase n=1 Tax=Asticcacaulis sp. EMRT-3 TaxID=3040349 RepID=UPI0024AF9468|nr:peptidylprolyl isomerase [Asticcacaulis sp. EMRT-3]MDI7774537.1 SurA N-terminal domain-containing protein [Asticcacaulis sp. EMRT-3]